MSTDILTCVCTQCSHEHRQDCINFECECCRQEDARQMVHREDED